MYCIDITSTYKSLVLRHHELHEVKGWTDVKMSFYDGWNVWEAPNEEGAKPSVQFPSWW